MVRVKSDNKWGYINKVGDYTIEPRYELVGEFYKGYAETKFEGKFGYINRKGEDIFRASEISYEPYYELFK